MVLVKPRDYIVSAKYFINAETNVDGVKFEREEYRDSLSEALELAKSWRTPNIKLSLSRTIFFSEGVNGGIPKQQPIDEDLTFGQLEKFASDGENLPKKQFFVRMTIAEARLAQAAVEYITGKPAEWRIVN